MTATPNPYLVDEENPELNSEQIKAMRPASEVLPPALYAKLIAESQARRAAREPVTLHLAPEVAAGPDAARSGGVVKPIEEPRVA